MSIAFLAQKRLLEANFLKNITFLRFFLDLYSIYAILYYRDAKDGINNI